MEASIDCKPIGYLSVASAGYAQQTEPEITQISDAATFEIILSTIFPSGKVHIPQVDFNSRKVVLIVDRENADKIFAIMLSSLTLGEKGSVEINCHFLPKRKDQGFLWMSHHISLLALSIPKDLNWAVNLKKLNQFGGHIWGNLGRTQQIQALEDLQAKEQESLKNMEEGYKLLEKESPEALHVDVYFQKKDALKKAITERDATIKQLWKDIYIQKLGPNLLDPLQ